MDAAIARTPQRPRELFKIKNGHFYLVRFLRGQEEAVADAVARWVNDPRLDFNWSNAAEIGEELQ